MLYDDFLRTLQIQYSQTQGPDTAKRETPIEVNSLKLKHFLEAGGVQNRRTQTARDRTKY